MKLKVGMTVQLKTVEQMKQVYGPGFDRNSTLHRGTCMTTHKYEQLGEHVIITQSITDATNETGIYMIKVSDMHGHIYTGQNTYFSDCVNIPYNKAILKKKGYKL